MTQEKRSNEEKKAEETAEPSHTAAWSIFSRDMMLSLFSIVAAQSDLKLNFFLSSFQRKPSFSFGRNKQGRERKFTPDFFSLFFSPSGFSDLLIAFLKQKKKNLTALSRPVVLYNPLINPFSILGQFCNLDSG